MHPDFMQFERALKNWLSVENDRPSLFNKAVGQAFYGEMTQTSQKMEASRYRNEVLGKRLTLLTGALYEHRLDRALKNLAVGARKETDLAISLFFLAQSDPEFRTAANSIELEMFGSPAQKKAKRSFATDIGVQVVPMWFDVDTGKYTAQPSVVNGSGVATSRLPETVTGDKVGYETPQPLPKRGLKFSLPKLPKSSGGFFGRKAELDRLSKSCRTPEINITVIVAPGGYGKTMLVEEFGSNFAGATGHEFTWYLEWSFYSQGIDLGTASSDPFFEAAYSFFGMEVPTGQFANKAGPLAAMLAQSPGLLILDGLEPLQEPPGFGGGAIRDNDLKLFLRMVAQNNGGLCIVTTRISVADLAGHSGGTVAVIELGNLEKEDAANMLRSLGVKGNTDELFELSKYVDCNPIALRLLGNLLAFRHEGVIDKQEISILQQDTSTASRVRRLLQKYHDWLKPEDLFALSLTGFFRRPATLEEASYLWTALRRSRAKVDWGTDELEASIERLSSIGLLYQSHDGYYLDCHPLIREYEREVSQRAPISWRTGHVALAEFLEKIVPNKPSQATEMFILYDAIQHRLDAGMYQYAWDEIVNPRLWQGAYVSTSQLGLLGAELATLRGFFDEPYTKISNELTIEASAEITSQMAFLMSSVNRLSDAVDIQTENYKIRRILGSWDEATIAAGSAAEYALILGNLDEATSQMSKSLSSTRHLVSPQWHIAAHCMAGVIRFELGQTNKSQWHFERAEIIFKQNRDDDEEYLGRASGFNLLWAKLDKIDHAIWQKFTRREKLENRFTKQLYNILSWANWCIQANRDSGNSIPIYHAWFNLVAVRCRALMSITDHLEVNDLRQLLEEARLAIEASGITRYLALIDVVSLDVEIADLVGRLDHDKEIKPPIFYQEVDRQPRKNAQVRYSMMRDLRHARRAYLLSNGTLNADDLSFVQSVARNCALRRFREMTANFDTLLKSN